MKMDAPRFYPKLWTRLFGEPWALCWPFQFVNSTGNITQLMMELGQTNVCIFTAHQALLIRINYSLQYCFPFRMPWAFEAERTMWRKWAFILDFPMVLTWRQFHLLIISQHVHIPSSVLQIPLLLLVFDNIPLCSHPSSLFVLTYFYGLIGARAVVYPTAGLNTTWIASASAANYFRLPLAKVSAIPLLLRNDNGLQFTCGFYSQGHFGSLLFCRFHFSNHFHRQLQSNGCVVC